MIVMDVPQVWSQRFGRSCHLISTLPGPEGTGELVAFVAKLGLRRSYIQNAGTATEHFDIFGSKIALAIRHGVRDVERNEFVGYIRAKRANPHTEKLV